MPLTYSATCVRTPTLLQTKLAQSSREIIVLLIIIIRLQEQHNIFTAFRQQQSIVKHKGNLLKQTQLLKARHDSWARG